MSDGIIIDDEIKLVLAALRDQGRSNREIGQITGIDDNKHRERLLQRLKRNGLATILKTATDTKRCWYLTAAGKRTAREVLSC